MSVRLRLAFLLTAVFVSVIAVFATAVYFMVSYELYNNVDSALARSGTAIVNRLALSARTPTSSLARALTAGSEVSASLYDSGGALLVSGSGATAPTTPPGVLRGALEGRQSFVNVKDASGDYRVDVIPVSVVGANSGQLSTAMVLVISESLQDVEGSLNTLKLVLILAGALSIAAAGAAAWSVAGRGLRPVGELTGAAERLGHGEDLTQRLPVPKTNDEIARLSAAFNGSLDRLETTYRSLQESLDRQRQFVADASHELRTPLTVMLTNTETLLDHPEMPSAEVHASLHEMRDEALRLAQLSESLLQLAKSDSGAPLVVVPVNWDDFVGRTVRDAEIICAPRPVSMRPNGTLGSGEADADSLLNVVRIIFDNVAQYTPDNTRVKLAAHADQERVLITIEDSGPGVRADLLPKIFDRFFRAEPSRTGLGSGLGLAIAKRVVERQGGEISARNVASGGLAIEMSIPRRVSAV